MALVKRLGRWLLIVTGGLLAVLIVVLGGLYVTLQSDGGRDWIARQVIAQVNQPGELEISLGRLGGQLPQAIELEDLTIRDGQGVWLSLARLSLRWRPLALLEQRLVVTSLEAQELDLARLPAGSGAQDESPGGLPRLPLAVRLEHADITGVRLGAPLLGRAVAFDLKGTAAGQEDGVLQVDFALERTDGVTGSARVEAHFQPSTRTLRLAAKLDEAPGGLVALVIGQPDLPALSASLSGTGTLDDWPGQLSANLDGIARLETDIRLKQDGVLKLDTKGLLEIFQEIPDIPPALLADGVQFDLAGHWDRADLVTLERAEVITAAASLALSGQLDLASLALEAQASAQARDDRAVSALLPGLQVEGLAVTLDAKGPLLEPKLALNATAARLLQDAIQVEDLTLAAEFAPDGPLDQGPPSGQLRATGALGDLSLEPSGDLAALIGRRFQLAFDGRLDLTESLVTASALSVESEQITAAGPARIDLDSGAGSGDLQVTIASFAPLARYTGLETGGQADLDAQVSLRDFGAELEVTLSGQLDQLTLGQPIADALFGGRNGLGANIHLAGDRLAVTELSLRGPQADLAGAVTLSENFERLESRYRLELPKAAELSAALGVALAGHALIEGTATGALANPVLAGQLTLENAQVATQALGQVQVTYSARDLASEPNGEIDMSTQPPSGPATAKGGYRLAGEQLILSDLQLDSLGTLASGQARVPIDGGPLSAEIEATVKSLRPWLGLGGLAGDGKGSLQVTLSPEGAKQAARLTGDLERLTLEQDDGAVTAETLKVTATLSDLLAKPAGQARIEATNLARDTLHLASVTLSAEGAPDDSGFELTAVGRSEQDPSLTAAGRIAQQADGLRLDLARFTGSLQGQELRLNAPTTIRLAQAAVSLEAIDLSLGQARLTAQGRIDRTQVDARFELRDLDLADLQSLAPNLPSGRLSAQLALKGPLAAPAGTIEITGQGLDLSQVADNALIDVSLKGRLADSALAIDGRIDSGVGQDALITGRLPLVIDPDGFTVEIPARQPLTGELTWQGDVAEIWEVFGIAGHDLAGSGQVGLTLSGTLDQPEVEGAVSMTNGRYENYDVGTLLDGLALQISFDGRQAVLTKLTASDGEQGRLSAEGALQIDPDRDFPLKLSATLNQATLVRRDDVTATAGGALTLAGSLSDATLAGKITTERVEISIAQSLPANVVDLDVQMVNFPGQEATDENAAKVPFDLALDLVVNMPRRVFVRGKGLDTEWSGAFKVKGTAAKPVITGAMSLVRGTVDVVGKQFKFDRGSITFDGSDKLDPLIDIEATSAAKSITVTVRVTGTATDPEITMTSSPEVPQDEMMAQLLFAKSTSELTTLELVQVGAAVAQLSGAVGSEGLGILDTARNLLGVDVLRIDSSAEGDPALAVGKYVADGVYLGVKQGATTESGAVTVDVDLTDNISVESDMTETGDSNIGVRFHWDY